MENSDKFSTVIKGQDGKDLTVDGKPGGEAMTLRHCAETALLTPLQGESDLPAAQKVKRYKIFNKIDGGATWESLKDEERALVKELIGKVFISPLVVGRCMDIIDPEA